MQEEKERLSKIKRINSWDQYWCTKHNFYKTYKSVKVDLFQSLELFLQVNKHLLFGIQSHTFPISFLIYSHNNYQEIQMCGLSLLRYVFGPDFMSLH